jgi:putative ATPase
MPEARIILSHATIFLALAPKSNSAYNAINAAMAYVQSEAHLEVPAHLKNFGQEKGNYKYPHSYPFHWVEQNYFADKKENKVFYSPGAIGSEKSLEEQHQVITSKKSH